MKFLIPFAFLSISAVTSIVAETKIACVGGSITFGEGLKSRATKNFPSQLANLLKGDFKVQNFGAISTTFLHKGDKPYKDEKVFQMSKDYAPDIVIINLGSSDAKPNNLQFKADFTKDTEWLVGQYLALKSKPRVIICKPTVIDKNNLKISDKILRGVIAKQLDEVAYKTKSEIIDLHPLFLDEKERLSDGVHPDAKGAEKIAHYLKRYLTQERVPLQVDDPKSKTFNFHGFEGRNIKANGTSVRIISPKISAKGNPWLWRARFWDNQPQLDIAMLELGWHVVFSNVGGLFGAPVAIERWEKAYKHTQSIGLSKKTVLMGLSRGGLPIHQWALKHPDKTGGIIGDNCVVDFTSWPGGFGGSKKYNKEWEQCKKAYGFKSDKEAQNYKDTALKNTGKFKQNNINILYLIGDADTVVIPSENSGKVASLLKGYENLKVIGKPGLGHHPHSLPNPAPLIDFALECATK